MLKQHINSTQYELAEKFCKNVEILWKDAESYRESLDHQPDKKIFIEEWFKITGIFGKSRALGFADTTKKYPYLLDWFHASQVLLPLRWIWNATSPPILDDDKFIFEKKECFRISNFIKGAVWVYQTLSMLKEQTEHKKKSGVQLIQWLWTKDGRGELEWHITKRNDSLPFHQITRATYTTDEEQEEIAENLRDKRTEKIKIGIQEHRKDVAQTIQLLKNNIQDLSNELSAVKKKCKTLQKTIDHLNEIKMKQSDWMKHQAQQLRDKDDENKRLKRKINELENLALPPRKKQRIDEPLLWSDF